LFWKKLGWKIPHLLTAQSRIQSNYSYHTARQNNYLLGVKFLNLWENKADISFYMIFTHPISTKFIEECCVGLYIYSQRRDTVVHVLRNRRVSLRIDHLIQHYIVTALAGSHAHLAIHINNNTFLIAQSTYLQHIIITWSSFCGSDFHTIQGIILTVHCNILAFTPIDNHTNHIYHIF
jgi:hypothetical protein